MLPLPKRAGISNPPLSLEPLTHVFPILFTDLSIPPPLDPEYSYTRQRLTKVIRFLFVSDFLDDKERLVVDVASALNLDLDLLFNVIFGPHGGLFRVYDTGNVPWEEFFVRTRSGARGIKDFLLDPARSREFYLGY